MSAMSERKLQVLRAIIEEYRKAAQPVGSRSLSKRADMSFSAATLRNEMADLEEMGYLEKAHASSGRIPTQRAYRLYVDRLLSVGEANAELQKRVAEYFAGRAGEVDDLCLAAAIVLSKLTGQVAVVEGPHLDSATLAAVQLLRVSRHTGLLVLVTKNGLVREALIPLPDTAEIGELQELASLLTAAVQNIPLRELNSVADACRQSAEDRQKEVIKEVFSAINKARSTRNVFLRGEQNIWKFPEYRDPEKARRLLSFFAMQEKLQEVLDKDRREEFSIRIGTEVGQTTFPDLSIVSASYEAAQGSGGIFGVIGPARMDYGEILGFLRVVGEALSSRLSALR